MTGSTLEHIHDIPRAISQLYHKYNEPQVKDTFVLMNLFHYRLHHTLDLRKLVSSTVENTR